MHFLRPRVRAIGRAPAGFGNVVVITTPFSQLRCCRLRCSAKLLSAYNMRLSLVTGLCFFDEHGLSYVTNASLAYLMSRIEMLLRMDAGSCLGRHLLRSAAPLFHVFVHLGVSCLLTTLLQLRVDQ